MERTASTVDLFAPWTKAQQTFWEGWREAMAGGAKPAVTGIGMWDVAFDMWKVAIYEGLEIPLAMTEMWKSVVCATDANIPEITEGAGQVAHFMEDWTCAQMHLWDGWFAAMESLVPHAAAEPGKAEPAKAAPRPKRLARLRAKAQAPAPAEPAPELVREVTA